MTQGQFGIIANVIVSYSTVIRDIEANPEGGMDTIAFLRERRRFNSNYSSAAHRLAAQ
jgi:hypothetical protein